MSKIYTAMFQVLVIFGLPAIFAFFIGRALDARHDIRPLGSVAALGVSFIFSWIIVIRMYRRLDKERKAIEAQEAAEAEGNE